MSLDILQTSVQGKARPWHRRPKLFNAPRHQSMFWRLVLLATHGHHGQTVNDGGNNCTLKNSPSMQIGDRSTSPSADAKGRSSLQHEHSHQIWSGPDHSQPKTHPYQLICQWSNNYVQSHKAAIACEERCRKQAPWLIDKWNRSWIWNTACAPWAVEGTIFSLIFYILRKKVSFPLVP